MLNNMKLMKENKNALPLTFYLIHRIFYLIFFFKLKTCDDAATEFDGNVVDLSGAIITGNELSNNNEINTSADLALLCYS